MAHAIDVRNRNAALFEQLEDRGLARQAGKCLGINPFISTNVEGDRAAVAADFRIPARTPAWLPLQHCHASADQPLNLPGEPLSHVALNYSKVHVHSRPRMKIVPSSGEPRSAPDEDGFSSRSEEHTSELQSLMR